MTNLMKLGYAGSNAGLEQELEIAIRLQHPKWSDEEVDAQLKKDQKKLTMYNPRNKKPKKVKKIKEPK